MNDQHTESSSHLCHGDLMLALRVVTGDLPPTTDEVFGDPAGQRPGWIDRRVILQTRIWVDRTTGNHRLDQMSLGYRTNVLRFLNDQASVWVNQTRGWEIVAAIHGLISGPDARDHLELLDLLTPGWTDHSPLGHELHLLNNTEPAPLAPAPIWLSPAETDTPQILREEDNGQWKITTQSTTTYLIDLDCRRINRSPGDPATPRGNGDHPRPPIKRLDFDEQWTRLDHLVRCQIGDPLIALDQRPGAPAGGYRISTPITHIEPCEDTRITAGPGTPTAPDTPPVTTLPPGDAPS